MRDHVARHKGPAPSRSCSKPVNMAALTGVVCCAVQPAARRGPTASPARGTTCARCSTAWAWTTRRSSPCQV